MTTRSDYIEKLAAKLHEWDARIDLLRAKAGTAAVDARIRYREEALALKEKRDEAADLIRDVREAGDNALNDVTKRVDHLLKEVKKAYKKAA